MFFLGQLIINCPFSIAMIVITRGYSFRWRFSIAMRSGPYPCPPQRVTCKSSRRLNSSFSRSRRRCCRLKAASHWSRFGKETQRSGMETIQRSSNVWGNHIALPFSWGTGANGRVFFIVFLDTRVWTSYNLIVSPVKVWVFHPTKYPNLEKQLYNIQTTTRIKGGTLTNSTVGQTTAIAIPVKVWMPHLVQNSRRLLLQWLQVALIVALIYKMELPFESPPIIVLVSHVRFITSQHLYFAKQHN